MTATAVLPPVHAPYAGGDPAAALKDAERIIADSIMNAPRSLQVEIGPSEIGNPCDHCLAAQLAGWSQNAELGWLPFVGTAVHSALEVFFIEHENHRNANHTTGRRYLTEHKVLVGQVAGTDVWGTCDLFDTVTGMTVDWKIVGITTLRAAKKRPKPEHRVQAHLYGRGWVNAGYRVEHVAIAHLPRNEQSMTRAVWWHEPYDEQVAVDALDRATQFAVNLQALATAGAEVRDGWITSLPRAEGCFDCPRYPDRPAGMTKPGHRPPGDQLAGLIDSPVAPAARG
ncbi:hypothetical protein [Ruania rhizosphaerae]|uniref:hypothetical protein n=1 Tax=Ruania rhizosphaerae TaxID=1840413 RepID=UPI0013592B8C|nr:hypothetical protein [Ruania rhizosphaerae]